MSEDHIKRSDAIEAVSISCRTCLARDIEDCKKCSVPKLRELINAIPSADRPQGEWLPFEFGDERWHKCSCCGTADKYIEYVPRPNGTVGKLVSIRNFCPNCGARMFAKDINVPNKKGADDDQSIL